VSRFASDDLIFLDESIFNEKTGWRYRGYAPIGHEARYSASVRRGNTWSILAAMTLDGYLPCTGVKEGYYNSVQVLEWLREKLFPAIRQQYGPQPKVIILDNCNVHIDEAVRRAIEEAGHICMYLPPYSPDYNPIELTFSVLKAWIRKHYYYRRSWYPNFGTFLRASIVDSRCDRFARAQFRHAAGGGVYVEQERLDEIREELRRFENGLAELEWFD